MASTGTACAAWASSTVEALLGRSPPFAALGEPGRGPAAGQGPATAASVPLPATPARRRAAGDGRRQSVDGASARHYRSGSVQAHPERRQALERLAAAARLQPGAAGQSPAGCDAAASALASVGLDGDCPQVRAAGWVGCLADGQPGWVVQLAGWQAGLSGQPLAALVLDGVRLACRMPVPTSCTAALYCPPVPPQDIRDHVTDEHLLQFAALVGEAASTAAAEQLGLPPAWAHDACLLGAADDPGACSEAGWEQVCVLRTPRGAALASPPAPTPTLCCTAPHHTTPLCTMHTAAMHTAGLPLLPGAALVSVPPNQSRPLPFNHHHPSISLPRLPGDRPPGRRAVLPGVAPAAAQGAVHVPLPRFLPGHLPLRPAPLPQRRPRAVRRRLR